MSQFKAKMHQIQFRLGLCLQCSPRGSLWELPTLPRPSWFTRPDSSKTLALYKSCTYLLTYFKGSTFKGGKGTGKERMGKEEGKGKDGEWDGMGKWRKGRGKEGKKGPGGDTPWFLLTPVPHMKSWRNTARNLYGQVVHIHTHAPLLIWPKGDDAQQPSKWP